MEGNGGENRRFFLPEEAESCWILLEIFKNRPVLLDFVGNLPNCWILLDFLSETVGFCWKKWRFRAFFLQKLKKFHSARNLHVIS